MKQQFDLSLWLKDKSRKIRTGDGRPVRIVCWDAKSSQPIVALVSTRSINQRQFDELPISYFNDGTYYGGAKDDFLDLFFADEKEKNIDDTEMNSLAYLTELGYTCIPPKKEEELTEFEKKLKEVLYEHATTNTSSEEKARQYAPELLDLARKELEIEITKEVEQKAINHTYAYQNGYENGKYDALKDLPKWKKDSNNLSSLIYTLDNRGDGRIFLCRKGYAININELLNLPKEE